MLLAHERVRLDDGIRASSNRAFGVSLAILLAIPGLARLLHGGAPRWMWIAAAACALTAALLAPAALGPLHRAWIQLALILHKVVNPLLMGILYFGLLTPMAALMRLFGRRALDLEIAKAPDASYWLPRDTATGSMKAPF
jgi:hypothetical protein